MFKTQPEVAVKIDVEVEVEKTKNQKNPLDHVAMSMIENELIRAPSHEGEYRGNLV